MMTHPLVLTEGLHPLNATPIRRESTIFRTPTDGTVPAPHIIDMGHHRVGILNVGTVVLQCIIEEMHTVVALRVEMMMQPSAAGSGHADVLALVVENERTFTGSVAAHTLVTATMTAVGVGIIPADETGITAHVRAVAAALGQPVLPNRQWLLRR